MKILLFYTYNQSFLAAFFNELALSLQERGWDVIVFSFKKESGIIEKPFRVKIKRKQNYLKNGVEIYKAIQKYKPDVVVSNFSYVNATVFSSRILGVKKNVVWFHTLSDQLNSNKFQIFRKSVFLKLASKIIVNSNELKIDLIDNYNVKPDKIVPIPFWSGLENDFVQKRQEKQEILKIGIPGRIEKVKNQKIILDLLLKYEELQNIKWVFAGSGSEEERLKDQVRKNKLENSIEFLGVLRSEEHTSELQSRPHHVCRLLLEKKKKKKNTSRLAQIQIADSRPVQHADNPLTAGTHERPCCRPMQLHYTQHQLPIYAVHTSYLS